MTSDSTASQMRQAATVFLQALSEEQRDLASFAFGDDPARRWLEYRPVRRPGTCLAGLSVAARKAANRLLSTALSDSGYAQAMVIIALEEVLDREEGWQLRRHSGDYWISVFGSPATDDAWSWRYEGHHLSVTVTVLGDQVSPAPLFLGAHPAAVRYRAHAVARPLAPEEDVAWALLEALGPVGRESAVVAGHAPGDIRTAVSPRSRVLEPLGVSSSALGTQARTLLTDLVGAYLDRLAPDLAAQEADRLAGGELHFAWEGPLTPGGRYYYRVQADDLLIEFDSTDDDGNHAHSVLRRPRGEFGDDLLAAHYSEAHIRTSPAT
jgi:Protein of unknown function (DUF3500)